MKSTQKSFAYYSPLILQKIGYVVFFSIYKIFVGIEIRGKEHLTHLKGPVILATNHTHELDPTVVPLTLPFFSSLFPVYFVSNPTEKYKTFGWRSYIYGGAFFNMLGAYSVHSGHHDYNTSLTDHLNLLQAGKTIFIFPEGKRTRDGLMNPARGGLGFLAFTSRATVVPIAIDTFFKLSLRDFFTFRRKIVVTIGAPLRTSNLFPFVFSQSTPTVEDFQNASQAVLGKIARMMK